MPRNNSDFMQAYDIDAERQQLVLRNGVKVPQIASDELLIKVAACGVNRADIFQRLGKYPPPKGASEIPGLEVSGVVDQVGDSVTQFSENDIVCALLEGGGYAEYVAVKASQVLPVPAHLNLVQASVLPEVLFTVWFNLVEKARVKPKETVLVHGGSSGVGVATIALCRMMNVTCIATTTHHDKVRKLQKLGASQVICAPLDEMVAKVKTYTQGQGVDVVLDMVGGDYTAANLRMLGYGGRLAIIALLTGAKAEVNLGVLLLKNLTITGATLRDQPAALKGNIAQSLQTKCWPWLKEQSYQPEIAKVFAFEEVNEAHAYMEQNQHIGKICLQLS